MRTPDLPSGRRGFSRGAVSYYQLLLLTYFRALRLDSAGNCVQCLWLEWFTSPLKFLPSVRCRRWRYGKLLSAFELTGPVLARAWYQPRNEITKLGADQPLNNCPFRPGVCVPAEHCH